MTSLLKQTAKLAIMATVLIGSIASAHAAMTVPAPPPRAPNVSGKCLTPNQVAARIRGNLHDRGIVDSFDYHYYDNNTKLRLYGLTERNVWSVFLMEMCRGSIVQQIPLRGRPAGI